MSATTNVSIRMDVDLKKHAEELFADLGLNMTVAMTMFLRQAVRRQGIPFEISRVSSDDVIVTMQNAKSEAAVEPRREIKFGFLKDKVPPLSDSFFDPLPEEELQAWGL